MTDLTQLWAAVTCHTAGCENADIPIAVPVLDPEQAVVCGPCGQAITDLVETVAPTGVGQ